MTLVEHAEHELAIAGADGDMAAETAIGNALLRVVAAFADQGHSGGSASIVGPRVGYVVDRLLAFEPITPLTGSDDEWVDIGEADGFGYGPGAVEQNRRCSYVFREQQPDGTWIAYALERVVWTDRPRGEVGFTAWDSARRIEFPWTPDRPKRRWKLWRRPITLVARLRGQLRP